MTQETRPADSPATSARLSAAVRWPLFALALLSLGLGVLGIFLPVLPTVPFVLLAAWAAAHSSPRLARWLEQHPRMGPHIVRWRQGGVVPRNAKWFATAMMAFSAVLMLVFSHRHWVPYAAIACMAVVLAWLWRRPEQAPG